LVLIGVTSAFVAPNLWKSYIKVQEYEVIQKFVDSINGFRHISQKNDVVIQLSKFTNSPDALYKLPSIPEGWSIIKMSTLIILPTGVINGGAVLFSSPTQHRWKLEITPIFGKSTIERI